MSRQQADPNFKRGSAQLDECGDTERNLFLSGLKRARGSTLRRWWKGIRTDLLVPFAFVPEEPSFTANALSFSSLVRDSSSLSSNSASSLPALTVRKCARWESIALVTVHWRGTDRSGCFRSAPELVAAARPTRGAPPFARNRVSASRDVQKATTQKEPKEFSGKRLLTLYPLDGYSLSIPHGSDCCLRLAILSCARMEHQCAIPRRWKRNATPSTCRQATYLASHTKPNTPRQCARLQPVAHTDFASGRHPAILRLARPKRCFDPGTIFKEPEMHPNFNVPKGISPRSTCAPFL